MSKWFEILKEEPEWKKRLKRIQEANRSRDRTKGGFRGRPNKCDRCGRKMGKASRYETAAGSTVCYQCRKRHEMGG